MTEAYYTQSYGIEIVWLALTCTHTAITSAKRETDLGGYSPRKAGSTIFPNASISWSCGVAHRTRDCSNLGFELQRNQNSLSDRRLVVHADHGKIVVNNKTKQKHNEA